MKILYLITGLGKGGAEKVVCDLADKMYDHGHDVTIVYFFGKKSVFPRNQAIKIAKIPLENILNIFIAYVSLSKFITKLQPDIVHSHMFHANIMARLVRLVTPIKKLICTAHSSNEGGWLRMKLYYFTHKLCDLFTNVSNYACDEFVKLGAVPKGQIKTIYNGVNLNDYQFNLHEKDKIRKEFNISSEDKIFLAVGRFHKAKNYPNLIKAINLIKERKFVLLIAGDGEERSVIENLIDQYNLKNKIFLLGIRDDISRLMSASDLFILSSDYEGLPTVLIEALACKMNVISTDVSGAREIIQNNNYIVPVGNYIILSDKIIDVIENIDERNELGYQNVRENFDLNNIFENWLQVYYE